MNTRGTRAAQRYVVALLLAVGLGGCVYDPYYSGHGYPGPSYGYSDYGHTDYGYRPDSDYAGPPVALNFGFYEHRQHGGYHGKHHAYGWRGHGHGHGNVWRGHGGSGGRGGWGHRGGRH